MVFLDVDYKVEDLLFLFTDQSRILFQVQVNNYEIVVKFFHISHNLT